MILVTPEESKTAIKIAKTIKHVRKLKGWTQLESAKIMGISQSAFSKMENAILIPSVHQWFEFCTQAGIPVDSYDQSDRLGPTKSV